MFSGWFIAVLLSPFNTWFESPSYKQQSALQIVSPLYQIDSIVNRVDERYLSVGLETVLVGNDFHGVCGYGGAKQDCVLNASSDSLRNLLRGLSPAYLRLGGTSADYAFFDKTTAENVPKSISPIYYANFSITKSNFNKLNNLLIQTDIRLLYDLNLLVRKDATWDPENAIKLFRHCIKMKFNHNLDFEIGNEPNSLKQATGKSVSSRQLADDFSRLVQILRTRNEFKSFFSDSLIVGPDVNRVSVNNHGKHNIYLKQFLNYTYNHPPDRITFHQYYLNGRQATVSDYLDPAKHVVLIRQIQSVKNVMLSSKVDRPLWIGETASAYGGGASGLSDTYIDGFMWLDKLGVSAQLGVDVVIRQSLYLGYYALLDGHMDPNPSYWLSVIFKKIVGRNVFNVVNQNMSTIRIYAHCTSRKSNYSRGSVTIFVINMGNQERIFSFPVQWISIIHQYLLHTENANLLSRKVYLNGKLLALGKNNEIPSFSPKILARSTTIKIPSENYAFFVLPEARSKLCALKEK